MIEFNDPEDAFPITGRGMSYSSGRWKMPPGMWDPDDITGQYVLLCGVEVKIIGVETFAIPRSESSPYPHSFALMVSLEDAERIDYVPSSGRYRS